MPVREHTRPLAPIRVHAMLCARARVRRTCIRQVGYRQLPQGTTRGGERERPHAHALTTHTDWHTHTRLTGTDRQARPAPWRIPRSSSSSLSETVCALQHTYTSGWPHRPHPLHWHTLSRSHSAHHLDLLGHSFPLSPCVCPLALRPAIMGLLPHRPKYALTHTNTHTKRTPGPSHRLAHTQQTRTERSKRT
jgi:hypothetical protein